MKIGNEGFNLRREEEKPEDCGSKEIIEKKLKKWVETKGDCIYRAENKCNEYLMYFDDYKLTQEEIEKAFNKRKKEIVEIVKMETGEDFWKESNIHLRSLDLIFYIESDSKKPKIRWRAICEIYAECCGPLD